MRRAARRVAGHPRDVVLEHRRELVRGVAQMIEDDRYCIDVVRQVQAARSALRSLETLIIDDHVDTCVQHALEDGGTTERREKVTELVSILTGRKK